MYAIDGFQINPSASESRSHRYNHEPIEDDTIKILLIEDDVTDVKAVIRALSKAKVNINTEISNAATLADALKFLSQEIFDIILLDLSLPDSIGLSSFQKIRKLHNHIPIVILTGETSEDLALQAVKEGAQEYLSKSDLDGKMMLRSLRYSIERHQLQTKLKEAYERQLLSQKLESMGLIAGGVAHDFNNLLAAISGNAELAALNLNPDSKINAYLKNVVTGCKRGGELCNQLMAYSGNNVLNLSVCDLNEMVEELHPLIKVSLHDKADLDYQPNTTISMVEADSAQIRQVIMNLITNASDSLGEAGGTISIQTGTLTLQSEFAEGHFWAADAVKNQQNFNYVKVADKGCGMDAATISKIFDPFFTTKITGRGLGLATVLGIVQAHGGALKVQSQPAKGSIFWLLLPPTHKTKTIRKQETLSHKSWKGQGSVLIADDEDELREALEHYIEATGFKAIVARDGEEAMNQFLKYQSEINMVLLDMTMPRISGKELYDKFTHLKPDIKIILMSGYIEQKIKNYFKKSKKINFIKKPFRLSELNQEMQKLFAQE